MDSPEDKEKQESGHQGHHGNTVAQVVDNEGDSVMQVMLPLLEIQTGKTEAWLYRSKAATPAISCPDLRTKVTLSSLRLLDLLPPGLVAL